MVDGEDMSIKRYCLLVVKKKKSIDMETNRDLEVVLRKRGDETEVLEGSNFRGWAGGRSEREEVGDPGQRQPIVKKAMSSFLYQD